MPLGTAGAITFIAEGAVALVAVSQVAASGPVVAGPGRTLVNVQLTVWALKSGHTVAAEVIRPWALGHTQSAVVAWLTGTALGLRGHTGVASILCSLAHLTSSPHIVHTNDAQIQLTPKPSIRYFSLL